MHTDTLNRYVEYIRNTRRIPLPVEQFDDDWEPIGPAVRRDLITLGLAEEVTVEGGIGIVLTAPNGTPESSVSHPRIDDALRAHPEATCQRCSGPNVVWSAPNDLWNRVMGSPEGIVCPRCFVLAAEKVGIHEVWSLTPGRPAQGAAAVQTSHDIGKQNTQHAQIAEHVQRHGLQSVGGRAIGPTEQIAMQFHDALREHAVATGLADLQRGEVLDWDHLSGRARETTIRSIQTLLDNGVIQQPQPVPTQSEATTRLQRWIEAIAQDIDNSVCPFGILEHIQKHAGPDLLLHVLRSDPDESGPIVDARIWSASMHNLLAIFDQMFCHVPITPEEQLARLEDQHRRNPTTRTKEPRDSRAELDQERYG